MPYAGTSNYSILRRSDMHRRRFLATAAASSAAIPLSFGRLPVTALSGPLFSAAASDPSERVLVLVNLVGGNDGLSSVVPLDQFDELMAVRANVTVPEQQLIGLDAARALHPALTGLRDVWDQGRLGILQGVGYPNQNGSHFRSTDIWNTASPSDEVYDTGWLGRHFQRDHPAYPDGYPNGTHPDPIAIAIGSSVSETCQGIAGNFSLTVNDPSGFTSILDTDGGAVPDRYYGDELAFIRTTISQANAYGSAVAAAAGAASNQVTYPDDNPLATHLSYVARMIAGGLQTKVYVVTLGGFDTHAAQVSTQDVAAGIHADLLRTLGDAVAAFQADIAALGLGERVLGMTYSEFGRRIRSNGALGTDHGAAAPAFLFGDCVNAGVTGENPTIDRAVGDQESVPMQYDFRDLYGSILEDWFGVPEADVRAILHEDYVRLPVLRDCSDVSDVEALPYAGSSLTLAPAVFAQATRVRFATAHAGMVRLDVITSGGAVIETLFERRLPAGEQSVRVDCSGYPRGVLFFRLREGASVRVVRGVRV